MSQRLVSISVVLPLAILLLTACGPTREERCENKGGTVHSVDVTDPRNGNIHRDYWCQDENGKVTDRW